MNNQFFSCLLILSALSGCASVTGTPDQNISIQTREQSGKEVIGAACDIINKRGTWFIMTPGTTSIHRSNDDIHVTCRKEGQENGSAVVVSDIKGSMFGNIVLGGGIGAMVDHNNGTAYEYPVFIQVIMGTLTAIETPKKEPVQQFNSITGASNSQSKQIDASNTIQKLKELKNLYDQGLISKDVYAERQKIVLDKQLN